MRTRSPKRMIMSEATRPPSMSVAARSSARMVNKAALTILMNHVGLSPRTISKMTLTVADIRSTQPSGGAFGECFGRENESSQPSNDEIADDDPPRLPSDVGLVRGGADCHEQVPKAFQ
jgi:hypothetical protein